LLGWNLARVASDNGYEVVGTYQTHEVTPSRSRAVRLDLARPEDARRLVEDTAPQVVIHAAAMSRPDDCARDPGRCQVVNVESTRALAHAAAQVRAKFVFLSSDLVYGDLPGHLDETMAVQPAGFYANSKLEAEGAALEETAGTAFIARTSLIYGWGSGAIASTFEEWLQMLRAGRPVRAFTDQRRCPTFVDDLAEAVLAASNKRLRGVHNVAGPEFLSRYAFAMAIAQEFGLDESLIEPFSIDDFGYTDPRPRELRLSNAKLTGAIGYHPKPLAEALRVLHEREGKC
jgi:dTDP-4-dehydrorhamnose reductase